MKAAPMSVTTVSALSTLMPQSRFVPAASAEIEPAGRHRPGSGASPAAATDARTAASSVQSLGATHILPMRISAGVQVSASGWLLPIGGAIVGGLMFGLPGALIGGIAGWLLSRR